jgi:hypothetical protein
MLINFAHEKIITSPSKEKYFSKLAEIFSNAKIGLVCPYSFENSHT